MRRNILLHPESGFTYFVSFGRLQPILQREKYVLFRAAKETKAKSTSPMGWILEGAQSCCKGLENEGEKTAEKSPENN